MENIFSINSSGYIKRRESFDLEFKQNFQLGDNIIKYIKTLVGMANNRGGKIVFGILNSPHIPAGMTNNKFNETDPAEIDKTIREYFSKELIWHSEVVRFREKDFGVISVEESEYKPIICKKNKGTLLREAAIYYRYRGESKEIEYPELQRIIDKEREKEQILWMQHIQQISMIGPKNVHLLDTFKGEISVGDGKILIEKDILDKIKFVKEGHFVETEGAPALKLIGNISGVLESGNSISPDILYPLFTKDLQDRLNLNSHDIQCVLWKLNIKGNKKYHLDTKTGKNSNFMNKYSEKLIPLLQRMIDRPDFLETCRNDYKIEVSSKFKRKKKRKK